MESRKPLFDKEETLEYALRRLDVLGAKYLAAKKNGDIKAAIRIKGEQIVLAKAANRLARQALVMIQAGIDNSIDPGFFSPDN